MRLRSDAPLIRHLTEAFGPATGRNWQGPPLVLLPGQGFVRYLMAHEAEFRDAGPEVEQLPWDDVVFDYQDGRRVITDRMHGLRLGTQAVQREPGPALLDRGVCWIRVRTMARYRQQLRVSSPWMHGPRDLLEPFALDPDRWLAVEAWEQNVMLPGGNERGFAAYPDVSLVPRDRLWDFAALAHLYPNLDCRSGRAFSDGHNFCNLARYQFPEGHPVRFACQWSELIMSAGVRLALLTLAYLLQCTEHLVEVAPAVRAKPGKDRKAGEVKPWVRSLPHLILLDPLRAREYGQPRKDAAGSEETGTGTAKRAPPRPHGRRGHWAVLRHERFQRNPDGTLRRVWVRQAWIGPAEWTAEGQRYRVVEPWGRRTTTGGPA